MTILTVGSGQQFTTLSAAIGASHDGDTLYVKAGTYVNDFATIWTNINIVGVGGMVNLVATQSPPNGKAILTTERNITLDHIEFSGSVVPDGNGAGIRYEGGNLTITNSYFHNNQDGILTAAVTGGTLTIDKSEFAFNGAGDGRTHNIYVSGIGQFQITNSYLHDASVGHELKSRADTTIVTNNRIFDNAADASYSVDVPNGGAATIQNNIIQQGPNSQNGNIIAYAEETSTPYANSQLTVSQNTILNERGGFAQGVWNNSSVTAQITGNQFYGLSSGQIASGPNTQSGDVFLSSEPTLDKSHPWSASPWDNLISGTAGNETLSGTAGRDLFVGGGGNDVFAIKAGGGSDTIADFAAGTGAGDVVQLNGYALGNFAAVQAALAQNGADTVLNLGNGETLTFQNILKTSLAADDFGFVNVGTTGSGSPPTSAETNITALYSAAFDRAPDAGGLSYWEGVYGGGMPLSAISAAFAGSAEFQAHYGASLDASGFVTQLYQNVLARAPDAGGLGYWTSAVQHGESRGDVLMGFAMSPENLAKLAAAGWLFGS